MLWQAQTPHQSASTFSSITFTFILVTYQYMFRPFVRVDRQKGKTNLILKPCEVIQGLKPSVHSSFEVLRAHGAQSENPTLT